MLRKSRQIKCVVVLEKGSGSFPIGVGERSGKSVFVRCWGEVGEIRVCQVLGRGRGNQCLSGVGERSGKSVFVRCCREVGEISVCQVLGRGRGNQCLSGVGERLGKRCIIVGDESENYLVGVGEGWVGELFCG